jgi:hypothetical protein
MAFIPNGAMKKPLNQLNNPIYPDIKQAYPEFKWSGKHWMVDAGRTLIETENVPQMLGDSVLVQSRDYNQTIYGKSSHRDYVNEEFRPPLLRQEDYLPLSRQPRPRVTPRTNPGTAHDSGTSGYRAQNDTVSEVHKYITDRIKDPYWRATFYQPIDTPQDNSVLPTLQNNIPQISATSGNVYNVESLEHLNAPINVPYRPHDKIDSRLDTPFYVPMEFVDFDSMENNTCKSKRKNNKMISIDAGHDYNGVSISGDLREFENNVSTLFKERETPDQHLNPIRDYASSDDGGMMRLKNDKGITDKSINHRLKFVSADSNKQYNIDLGSDTQRSKDSIRLKNKTNISADAHREYHSTNNLSDVEHFKANTTKIPQRQNFSASSGYTGVERYDDQPNNINTNIQKASTNKKLNQRINLVNPFSNVTSTEINAPMVGDKRRIVQNVSPGINVEKLSQFTDNTMGLNRQNNIGNTFKEKSRSHQPSQYTAKGYVPRAGLDVPQIARKPIKGY